MTFISSLPIRKVYFIFPIYWLQIVIANNYMLCSNYYGSQFKKEIVKLYIQIGGIGKVTEHILRDALGINTCEEMLLKGSYIFALFSHSSAGSHPVIPLYFVS